MRCVGTKIAVAIVALGLATSADAQTFRTNIPADPAMVDPITYSELVAGDVMGNMYEGFTGIDGDGNVVPALAESWEADDDNLGFTFHLRPGVKFHSGRPFTAADVKYTLEELLRPGNKGGLNTGYLDNVVGAEAMKSGEAENLEGVTVVDDATVAIRFSKPEVLFPIYPIWFMDSGIVDELGPDWAHQGIGRHRPLQVRRLEPRRGREARSQCRLLGRGPLYRGGRLPRRPH